MKQNHYFKRMLSAMLLLMASTLSWAYDFEAENADGITIYYNLINNKTEAEVAYYSMYSSSNSSKYSGDIVIPSTVVYDGKTLSVTSIGSSAFNGCSGLTSVTIPEGVTSIGHYTFQGCSSLTSVTIPESVTSIGHYTFQGCSSLTAVTIPEGVTSIGSYAFMDCSNLTSANIPEGVTIIDKSAFSFCSSLTSITIPNSVTRIGDSAFSGCSGLTSVIVDEGNPVYDSRDNCNAIIETASNTLVAGCQSTVIPNSVTSIGSYAFQGCSSLTAITIPESVTEIGNFTFIGCSSLTSVTIPESVTDIGGHAFRGCSSLTSVTIPNSVTSIGNQAFDSCSGLTSVYSLIETPFSILSDVFGGIADGAILYVPQGTKDTYEATEGWTEHFSNIVEFDTTDIADTPAGRTEGYAVYDLNGTKVNMKGSGMKSLPRGIYVVNGKKTIVK